MISKSAKLFGVIFLISIFRLILSSELKESELTQVDNVFDTIEKKQNELKSILKRLISSVIGTRMNMSPIEGTTTTTVPDPDESDEKTSQPAEEACVCVPFYQCDSTTKQLITDGKTLLLSRMTRNSVKCIDPTHFCCKKPNVHQNMIMPSKSEKKCGYRIVKLESQNAIKNKSQLGEYPWTVLIVSNHPKTYKCAGSLIHPKVVLTAAHCLNQTLSYSVIAGKLMLKEPNEPLQMQNVDKIIKHSMYNDDNLRNDIALLILKEEFTLTDYVNTICLPDSSSAQPAVNENDCVANGWGTLNHKSRDYVKVMKKVQLSLLTQRRCENILRGTRLGMFFQLSDCFICASIWAGESLCNGDAGGPLVCPMVGHQNRYQQVGSLSWGLYCDEDPQVFVKIAHFKNWIDDQFKLLNFDSSYYRA